MVTEAPEKESTQNPDNKALIAQMIKDAEAGEEPGGKTAVVNEGDAKNPYPMISNSVSAGYTVVWRTDTGQRLLINNNNRDQCLAKKREDGKPAFSLTRPTDVLYKAGTIKCLLHPSQPNHEELLALGFKPCRKSNIPNEMQLQMHMETCHAMEWKTLEAIRTKAEKDEERHFQHQLMNAVVRSNQRERKAK